MRASADRGGRLTALGGQQAGTRRASGLSSAGRVDRGGEPASDAFPWLVTLGALVLGLVIFAHSTRPALAERDALRDARERLETELQRETDAIHAAVQRRSALQTSPEHVLTELDRRGLSAADADREASRLDGAAAGPVTSSSGETEGR
ncbi:MAG: hypothetical protein IPM29_20190 [Planctomycetes bacterium]|nr:hypothetical protein [Planctomycetota bacterium]